MTQECRDYLKMAFRSIHCFSNDGQLLVRIGQIRSQHGF